MRPRDWLIAGLIIAALEALEHYFGHGVAFTVAIAAMSFCVGALWQEGKANTAPKETT